MSEDNLSEDSFIYLMRHPCCQGMPEDEIRTIADAIEIVSYQNGEYVHRANERLNEIYLIVQGRLTATVQNANGTQVVLHTLIRGSQFGILAGARIEPMPVSLIANEPSTLLKLDYHRMLDFAARFRQFQLNLFRIVGDDAKKHLSVDRIHPQPQVVAVVHQSDATRALTPLLVKRLQQLGERPCVATDDPDWQPMPEVPFFNLVQDGRYISRSQGREKIKEWSEYGRIFLDCSCDLAQDNLERAISFADRIFWCVRPQDWPAALEAISALQNKVPGWREKTDLVWVLDDQQRIAPYASDLLKLIDQDFKLSLSPPSGNQNRLLANGVERLVHRLRGVQIGVALGGGAARGMAHLGVLRALENAGIVIDMIAGTSAGAMTGALYAAGLDADYLVDCFTKDLRPAWIFRHMRHGGYWDLLYKYRSQKFDPMLRKYVHDERLEQAQVPMQTVTVDLVSGEPKVRTAGDTVESILESINLPGLALPIRRDNQALVDGGLVNNIPADVLVSRGCNFVIAVSVTAKLEQRFAGIHTNATGESPRSPSTIETIMRGYLVQSANMNSIGVHPADVIIEPDATQFDLSEFTRAGELACVGEKATIESIPNIQQLLSQLDPELFGPAVQK